MAICKQKSILKIRDTGKYCVNKKTKHSLIRWKDIRFMSEYSGLLYDQGLGNTKKFQSIVWLAGIYLTPVTAINPTPEGRCINVHTRTFLVATAYTPGYNINSLPFSSQRTSVICLVGVPASLRYSNTNHPIEAATFVSVDDIDLHLLQLWWTDSPVSKTTGGFPPVGVSRHIRMGCIVAPYSKGLNA
jgi:hypothetical protein